METARANLDWRAAKAANGASLPQLFRSASAFLRIFFISAGLLPKNDRIRALTYFSILSTIPSVFPRGSRGC
jgi:hypothetical protein